MHYLIKASVIEPEFVFLMDAKAKDAAGSQNTASTRSGDGGDPNSGSGFKRKSRC